MFMCPIQLRTSNPVQAAYFRFTTSSSYERISRVELYDGPLLVRTMYPPTTTYWSGTKSITYALGSNRNYINGATMAIYVTNAGTVNARFRLIGCGVGTA